MANPVDGTPHVALTNDGQLQPPFPWETEQGHRHQDRHDSLARENHHRETGQQENDAESVLDDPDGHPDDWVPPGPARVVRAACDEVVRAHPCDQYWHQREAAHKHHQGDTKGPCQDARLHQYAGNQLSESFDKPPHPGVIVPERSGHGCWPTELHGILRKPCATRFSLETAEYLMRVTSRQICRTILLCTLFWCPSAAAAQTLGGIRPQATAPSQRGVLTRFRSALDIRHLNGSSADARFDWDLDLSVDADLFDLGIVRGNLFGNFETIIGRELRDIDPNQTNYLTDISFFVRLPRGELGAMFHHVSRHLSDRADRGSISWNMVGVSYGDRFTIGALQVDAGGRGMGTVERAGVDYLAQFEWYANLALPLNPRTSVIAATEGVVAPVDAGMFSRETRTGGRLLGGLRFVTGAGAVDLFLAWEKRIDADAFTRETGRWIQFGIRLSASAP